MDRPGAFRTVDSRLHFIGYCPDGLLPKGSAAVFSAPTSHRLVGQQVYMDIAGVAPVALVLYRASVKNHAPHCWLFGNGVNHRVRQWRPIIGSAYKSTPSHQQCIRSSMASEYMRNEEANMCLFGLTATSKTVTRNSNTFVWRTRCDCAFRRSRLRHEQEGSFCVLNLV